MYMGGMLRADGLCWAGLALPRDIGIGIIIYSKFEKIVLHRKVICLKCSVKLIITFVMRIINF